MRWGRGAATALTFTILVLALSAQAQIWTMSPTYDTGGRTLQAAMAAAFTLPLLVGRRWPLPVLMIVLGATSADQVLGGELGQPWFAVLLALYALGAHGSPAASGLGLGVSAGLVLAVDLPRLRDGAPIEEVLPAWFILVGVWGLGRWMQHRRLELAQLAAHAESLERDRAEASRAAVAHERARIARELHDLVAHSMAVIVLQAQAADRGVTTDVAATRRSLAAIDRTGREGMGELRRLLDLLLVDVSESDLDPRATLEEVDQLVDRVREAGLPVSLAVEGVRRPLPPGVDVSAYRIIQEALTNALKHAGQATASVGVTYRPDSVEIRVADSGTPGHPASDDDKNGARPGHGLIGMHERAALYGGAVEAGPTPGGGFAVRATLPTESR